MERRKYTVYKHSFVWCCYLLVKEEINMSGIESSNQGPGWHDHEPLMARFIVMMVIIIVAMVDPLEGIVMRAFLIRHT